MGQMNLEGATPPARRIRKSMLSSKANPFRDRMPLSARRHVFIRQQVLWPAREAPVNPEQTPIGDVAETTAEVKTLVREMGAQMLGIAAYDPRFAFTDAVERDHTRVIVLGMPMTYDCMIDIGPRSQGETHRVYYRLDDMANRLSHHLGAYGYSACAQPNSGDLPLPAYGYLAGLGELGKHGSLISPEYGSSFRLSAVSTDMPLVVDGPRDLGIDEICQSCNVCSRFCPGEAISAEKQEVNGIVRWHVDTPACQPWFNKMHGCKMCLMVCPFNARGAFKDAFTTVAKDIRASKDAPGLVRLIGSSTSRLR